MGKLEWMQRVVSNASECVPVPRANHGCSVIGDCLYVYGGDNEPNQPIDSDVWCTTLAGTSLSWSKVAINNVSDGPEPRVAHAQAQSSEGFYIFGGFAHDIAFPPYNERPLNDLYYFELLADSSGGKTGRWVKQTPAEGSSSPPSPRSFHKMCVCRNLKGGGGDLVFVFGGCAAEGRLADLHVFDTVTKMWTTLEPSEAAGRGGAGLIAATDGKIYVIAGYKGSPTSDCHCYDIVIGSACGGILTIEGSEHIVMVGGEVAASMKGHDGAGSFTSDLTAVLRIKDGTATSVSPRGLISSLHVPEPRGWAAADNWGTGSDRKIVLFGGLSGDDSKPVRLNDVWVLQVV